MTKKEIVSLIILACVFAFGLYRYKTREYVETKSQYVMDTIVEISASSKNKTIGRQIDSVFAYIKTMELKLNEYDPNSLIWQINNSELSTHPMDPDIYNLLVIADSLYQMSNGAFDVTIKPLFDIWKFDADSLSLPEPSLIEDKLKLVGFEKIKYDQQTLFKPAGMQLTFGALAKGYIIDNARELMHSLHLDKGFINSRSSMTFFGNKLAQVIYIQHPRKTDDYIATFRLKDLSVATSGDYQQFFELDGIRYHHILSPFTGYPIKNMYSVTVVHPSAAWADGLSTALFVMVPNSAADAVNQIPDCDAVIYYDQDGTPISLKTNGMKSFDLSEKL